MILWKNCASAGFCNDDIIANGAGGKSILGGGGSIIEGAECNIIGDGDEGGIIGDSMYGSTGGGIKGPFNGLIFREGTTCGIEFWVAPDNWFETQDLSDWISIPWRLTWSTS